MHHAPHLAWHAHARLLVIFGAIWCVLLAASPSAHAAYRFTLDGGYTAKQTPCGAMLGQSDDNGTMYLACGDRIKRYDRNGTALTDVQLWAPLVTVRDVAPSPDGRYLYVTQGTAGPRRLVQQANGTYLADADWRLRDFPSDGALWKPIGHVIATDGRGDIYVSAGSYWIGNTQPSVVKYSPAGTVLAVIGDFGKQDGSWITNQDIAVSRDGRRLFVGENCGVSCTWGAADYQGSRVTRYDFSPNGVYRFAGIIGARGPVDGYAFPQCDSPGALHSAYSLALDAFENLYVTSTTCGRLQMFDTDPDPAKDVFVKTIASYYDNTGGWHSHYLASDWAGRLWVGEWTDVYTPRTITLPALPLPRLEPLPTPDIEAPVINEVRVPATTATVDITVSTTATDNVAVAEMRLAREDGTWGPWQPFARDVTYRLSAGFGLKGVYVQVRDMAGNESTTLYRTLRYQADAPAPATDIADPVLTSLTIPPLTATNFVDVTVVASDDIGVTQVRYANEDGNWGAWQAFLTTRTWQLSAGAGAKVVYAQVRDAVGRESGVLTARTKVAYDAPPPQPEPGVNDTTAPSLTRLAIAAETTTQQIDVTLEATDNVGVVQVRFANEDGNWTAWRAWSPQQTWQLSPGYGAKLIYAAVRDAAGNESITLTARTSLVQTLTNGGGGGGGGGGGAVDAANPVLSALVLPTTTRTAAITVRLTASDDIAVTQLSLANEDGTWGAWQPWAADVQHQLSAGIGYKAVYARVRDAAGRESNVLLSRTQVVA